MRISFDNKVFILSCTLFYLMGLIPAFAGEYLSICRFIMAGAILTQTYLIIKEYALPSCSKFNNFVRFYLIVYIITGIPYILQGSWGESNFPVDFAAFGFLIIGWRFYEIPVKIWKIALFSIFILTLLCFVYTKQWETMMLVASYDKGLGHADYSTYAYMMVFASFVPPAILIADRYGFYEKYRILFYVGIGLACLICLITQKRALMLDLSLLLLYVFALRLNKISLKYLFSLIALFFVLSYLLRFIGIDVLTTLINGIFDRYQDTSENVAEFDRLVEMNKWLESASPIDIIFGSGLGSFQKILTFTNYHLHLGWPNLVYKGGLFLATAIGIIFIQNIKFALRRFSSQTYKAILFLTILTAIHLMHSTAWGYSIDAMALSMVIYSRNKIYQI